MALPQYLVVQLVSKDADRRHGILFFNESSEPCAVEKDHHLHCVYKTNNAVGAVNRINNRFCDRPYDERQDIHPNAYEGVLRDMLDDIADILNGLWLLDRIEFNI